MATQSKSIVTKDSAMKIGTGIGLVATALGAYFLYGTKGGIKRRKQIHSWMLKAKADVYEELEGLKEVNQEVYENVVDKIVKKYEGMKGVELGELVSFGTLLKSYWSKDEKKIKKRAPKATKKLAKAE